MLLKAPELKNLNVVFDSSIVPNNNNAILKLLVKNNTFEKLCASWYKFVTVYHHAVSAAF